MNSFAAGALRLVPSSLLAFVLAVSPFAVQAQAKSEPAVNVATCANCHTPVTDMHKGAKHAKVNCNACHTGIQDHIKDTAKRPKTITDPAACGACHKPQYESAYKMNWEKEARNEKSQYGGPSPNPSFEKLMIPHGFTKEHNEPRSHAFALYDQLVVDRAFGGRFADKRGWQSLAQGGGNFKIWDVLEDLHPGEPHKAFKPGTAAAANPVCLNCKTQDHILDWAYMGDPVDGAKWSRTSNVVAMVKDVNHALNCFFCHDPHSAQPRIVRDGLIQALTRPEKDTLWHKDPRGAKIEVKDMGVRGFTRKIAVMNRYDTNLQCGQCHVEYNCNPGTNPTSGEKVTMADQRANHFPYKNVWEIAKHYDAIQFRDFKHAITGALLWKGQHPDVENYYDSKHQKAGVECSQCHMPKMKDKATGKTFTSHWQVSPKHYIKETCLTCHREWSETQAKYVIESLRNRFEGKKRKAEFWLTRFIDKFEQAQGAGVPEDVLKQAREIHWEADIHWEWWTASNGAHFHNPDQAVESLNKSMALSQQGIKLLDEAMAKAHGGSKQAAAQ
ncbi:MAG TPA: ammonia-forming cytochrome c nitrite reductase subunit c552 [Pelomicrobium sp.]|nr:ammonia-forming cytochrome c nitrite reductase subunit c552 [Pelomicrobium sp.]